MKTTPASEPRELDIVVLGATGFVGRLLAGYLAGAAPAGVRIGLAGRSRERLAAVRDRLGAAAERWPLLLADLGDQASLTAVARMTRVLATTAGPFSGRGLPLAEACVIEGTDYADLTGEVLFIRDSIDRYHAGAVAEGVRIVHACGVDSIPSDLGVLLLAETTRKDGAGTLEETIGLVTAFRGGFSGGTWMSARRQLEETSADPERQKIVDDAYALTTDHGREPELGEQRDLRWIEHDTEHGHWLARFIMAGVNTRIVRRSNALQNWAYGRRFRYREARAFPDEPTGALAAAASATGLRLVEAAFKRRTTRPVFDRLLPAPGEGPGERRRSSGRFSLEIHARASDGSHCVTRIAAAGDPGYTVSPVLIGQSALCLALDRDRLPSGGGVLTPATAMGAALIERLRKAGVTLDVQRRAGGGD